MKKILFSMVVIIMMISVFAFNVTAVVNHTSDMSLSDNTAVIRMELPLKMAIRFENGNVYYGGENVKVDIGTEYKFQMCTVNWDNGLFDDFGNGICGTVVYTMQVLGRSDFYALRNAALEDAARYTVKGDDVIDNVEKKICVNSAAGDLHLETDVNNFFMAYRFSFSKGSYNKKTKIEGVVNTPTEALSVNLPVGATVKCEAVINGTTAKTADILIENNSGTGIYNSEFLTSVNDYVWDATAPEVGESTEVADKIDYDSTWAPNLKIKAYAAAMKAILDELGKQYTPASFGYLFGGRYGEYGVMQSYHPEGSAELVSGEMYSIQLCDLDANFYVVASDGSQKTLCMRNLLAEKGLDVDELRGPNGIAPYAPFVLLNSDGVFQAVSCTNMSDNKHGDMYYGDGKIVEIHHTADDPNFLDNFSWNDMAYYAEHEAEAIATFGLKK